MEERLRILLCEDDENLGMLLREYLQAKGYNADLLPDGESGYKAFLKGKYDLCVLDVMMPKKDGFALAQEIRTVNGEVPIIFLTARSSENDLLTGFSAGGDDYICKPFSINEVIARVKAVLKRSSASGSQPSVIWLKGISIDLQSKNVTVDGAPVPFSRKEYDILLLLASNPGKIFSRTDFIRELWKDAPYVMDRTVDVHIARIRSKLGQYRDLIVNRAGFGYSMEVNE